MLKIEILTIFPEIFESFISTSLIAKAIDKDLLSVKPVNIRDFASPPHFKVDDEPYGGGAGMLMKPEPIFHALEKSKQRLPNAKVILLSAAGKIFNQSFAQEISKLDEIIFICGRYEGIDQRVIDNLADFEISIGDFVLLGGEIPAMTVIEAIARLKPEIIGNEDSLSEESFAKHELAENLELQNILEAPQYTRPAEFQGWKVPEVLLEGNHQKIKAWRKDSAIKRTKQNRPDLIKEEK